MCTIFDKVVLCGKTWQPLIQTLRYNRRVNIQRPRPPHYERARIEVLCKPIYAKPLEKYLPNSQKCKKTEEEAIRKFRIDNPFENILARQFLELYNGSRLIAICHKNVISAEDRFNMFIRFKRDGMTIKEHGKHLQHLALKGTKYESVLHLVEVHQVTIFCKEPKVEELLKNLKKTPQIILLAAIIDGYFANVAQVDQYAKLKDISHARAQLVSVLNSAAQSIVTGLNQHQTMLVAGLDQYVNMKQQDIGSVQSDHTEERAPSEPSVPDKSTDPPSS